MEDAFFIVVTMASATIRVATPLDFPLLSALALKPRQTSAWKIAHVLDQRATGSYPRHVYELWFHKKLAGPLLSALAVLLLAPLVQQVHRLGAMPLLFVGLATGFLCFVADAIMAGLGGRAAPTSGTWGMPTKKRSASHG